MCCVCVFDVFCALFAMKNDVVEEKNSNFSSAVLFVVAIFFLLLFASLFSLTTL